VKTTRQKRSAESTAGRGLRRASPSWGGGSDGEVKVSRQKSSLPATAAPTAGPSSPTSSEEESPNRGPQALIDLTSNSDDEKGREKMLESSNQMHKKQGKGKKQVLIHSFPDS